MEKELNPNIPILHSYMSEATPSDIVARYESLFEAVKTKQFGVLDEDVVVLDTETTGVSFKHDELIQIAAARMKNGEITEWLVTFVNPGKFIPDAVQHLTNIHHEDVVNAPLPEEALTKLVEFVGDSPVVAHNAAFDKNFTTKHEQGYPLRNNLWIDSLDLARIALPHMKSHRLKDLIHAFGGPASTHRADDDVAATCVLYRYLLAAVDAMPKPLVIAISKMATEEEWATVAVFKYFAEEAEVEMKQQAQEEIAQRNTLDQSASSVSKAQNLDAAFSLHAMRRRRVLKPAGPPRGDAAVQVEEGRKILQFPTSQEVSFEFGPEGALGRAYTEYEPRQEQETMALAVNKAFSTSTHLVVEAGTGVGKSMAYLVPAVLAAKRNNVTFGIATKTNNLLDQLVNKELPLLSESLGSVTYAALKGFTHYPCLRKIQRVVDQGPRMVETKNGEEKHQAPSLAALLSFIEQSDYNDIDSLKIEYRSLPRYAITCASNDCLRRKCPYFGKMCFVHGARRAAESADILVTNHSMLFCNLAADGALLPPVRYWVIDEAHGAEAEARRAFSQEISAEAIYRMVNRASSEEASRNPFIRVERQLGSKDLSLPEGYTLPPELSGVPGEGTTVLFALTSKARSAGKVFETAAQEFCAHMKDLLYFDTNKRSKGYETVEMWVNEGIRNSGTFDGLAGYARGFIDAGEKLVYAGQNLVSFLDGYDMAAAAQREIAAMTMELKETIQATEGYFFNPSPLYAYSANLARKRDRDTDCLTAQMVNVGGTLEETLYETSHSVIFTSATITVDNSFDSFKTAMGLDTTEQSHATYLQLDSSYDFDRNMTVYVVSDMPEPNEVRYLQALQTLLIGVHRAQHGSTLSLFTNRKEMENCYDVVSDALVEDRLRVVCQKWGVSVKGLRDDFVADKQLSLFALKSFWEGFDAPGATLKTVVIPKLPFKKPSDPLSCQRAEQDNQAWAHYVLPEAVIEVKQAAGRLIRSASDTGNLVLADKRLVSKGYGKKFLRSLPSRNIHVVTMAELFEDIRRTR